MAKTQVLNTEEARHLASFIRSLSADIQTLQTNMQNKLAGTTFCRHYRIYCNRWTSSQRLKNLQEV